MQQVSLYVMVSFYVMAGVNHFINPKFYLKMMPPWLPAPDAMNKISGACEVIFACMLIPEGTRILAGWLIIVLLVAVFPANIQMSLNFYRKKHRFFWLSIARLPLQIVLLWWAWHVSHR